jgi:hypothetical protein
MNREPDIQSYQEQTNKLRSKLNQLEVNSVEQRASDEVRKWRHNFDTSSSSQLERMLNEMEKRKQLEVSQLTNELRTSLDQFKQTILNRLDELDAFVSKINTDDDIQLDYAKSELDTISKKIKSLHVDIIVKVTDTSNRRRSSTIFTRNTLELAKVFEFKDLPAAAAPSTPSSPSSNILDPLTRFVRRTSITGASYYNVGVPEQKKDS